MEIEYEARISGINIEETEEKLKKLGAKKIGKKNYKRYIYEHKPKKEGSWIRLRTDGEKTTLTIKDVKNKEIDGTKETEIIVNDIEKTNELLNNLGFFHRSYQENKRTKYLLNNVKVEIDEWPMIPPHVEIEGKNIEEVEKTIKLLGFKKEEAISGKISDIYKKHGIDSETIKELKFN
jgi:adenylate cyclase class 2